MALVKEIDALVAPIQAKTHNNAKPKHIAPAPAIPNPNQWAPSKNVAAPVPIAARPADAVAISTLYVTMTKTQAKI